MRLIFAAEHPSEGQIIILGRNVDRLRPAGIPALRRRIGVVFQDFKLLPRRTVEENVAVALDVVGVPHRQARARVFSILKRVGLQHRRFHYPLTLSGGEQQRVAVARAIALEPPLLLADEPTGNLDSATGKQIIDLLVGVNRRLGCTLVLVTHDAALAAHADRVVTLRDGRIVSDE
jgi:cell division transport system ATP-binding protein